MLSKYQVPNGFGFSPKASGFYPFGDATALAGEVGVGDVMWLIQASASNHKPKGRFFWFVVYVVCLKSDMPRALKKSSFLKTKTKNAYDL